MKKKKPIDDLVEYLENYGYGAIANVISHTGLTRKTVARIRDREPISIKTMEKATAALPEILRASTSATDSRLPILDMLLDELIATKTLFLQDKKLAAKKYIAIIEFHYANREDCARQIRG